MSYPNFKVGGLTSKYIIQKANGAPIDENAEYLVLRLDTDPHARSAALHYAEAVGKDNPVFASDLKELINRITRDREAALTYEVEELRAALKRIADWESNWGAFPETNNDWATMAVMEARRVIPQPKQDCKK